MQTLDVQAGSDPSLNIGADTLAAGQVNIGGEINGEAATGSLGLESGTLSSSTINVGGGSGSSVLAQSGGYINPGAVNVESGGTVSQTGGTDVFSGITLGGTSQALYDLEFGTVTLSTLTINSGGDLQAGYTAEYNFWFFAGTVTVNPGGALHLADADVGGGDANTFATLNVNGGTVGSVDLIVTGAYNYTSGNTSALTLDLVGTATTNVGNWTISGLYADSSVPLTIGPGESITASGQESVADSGAIAMDQTGGTNSAELLVVGNSSIADGVYNLSNGTLDVSNTEWIGEYNVGTLNQSGGTNTLPGVAAINLGWGNGTVGYYTLSGGIVSTSTLNVGMGYNFGQFTGGGSGTFVQTGGTAELGALNLSVNSLSAGTYSLSGSSLLSVSGSETVGVAVGSGGSGAGTFIQTGGTNTDSGSLTIGPTGEYLLSGGSLSAAAINVSGNMSVSGGATVAGPLNISGAGTVTLGSGGGPQTFSSLTISGSGILDLTNNHIFITYGSSDPMATIIGYLQSGFNNGGWNGSGIISSTAQSPTNGLKYGVGFADGKDGVVKGLSSGQIELKYTLLGDANLDGTVNGSDFSILAANFGLGTTNWDQGNFLFTSAVNGSDFSALAANFGQGDSGAAASVTQADIAALDSFAVANGLPLPAIDAVPEPGAIALAAVAAGMLIKRRGRG